MEFVILYRLLVVGGLATVLPKHLMVDAETIVCKGLAVMIGNALTNVKELLVGLYCELVLSYVIVQHTDTVV